MPKTIAPIVKGYQEYYGKLSPENRRRFWIMLGHQSRAEYVRVESYIGHLADSELNFRILWKPES